MSTLEVKNLHVSIEGKAILKGLDLKMQTGEIHAIMGPNGTGKSTLSEAIMGNPAYTITEGEILLDGENILDWAVDERARAGLFLAMQYPAEVPGVTNSDFLRTAMQTRMEDGKDVPLFKFIRELDKSVAKLEMREDLPHRYLNEGFSGGEKKKNEILQMLMLKPKLAILDETDSGLDVDAIRTVSKGIEMFKTDENAVLIITHSTKILQALKVDYVHILVDGKIVFTGDASLAKEIEEHGYEKFKAGVKNA